MSNVKYVVQLTMQSGVKFAASVYTDPKTRKRTFALVPFDQETESVRNALVFDTVKEAEDFMDSLVLDDGTVFLDKWEGTASILPMMEPH